MSEKLDIVEKLNMMIKGHDSDEICLTVNTLREAIKEIETLREDLKEFKSLATDISMDSQVMEKMFPDMFKL